MSAPAAGQKRKWSANKNADGQRKKRKHRLTADGLSATQSIKAIFISCDINKKSQSKQEMLTWLNEYADQLYPIESKGVDPADASDSSDDDQDNKGSVSLSDDLERELALLRGKSSNVSTGESGNSMGHQLRGRFEDICVDTPGVLLLRITDDRIDPGELVAKMLSDLAQTQTARTRFTMRVVPMHATSFSRLAEILASAKPVIDKTFAKLPADTKFAIEFRRRVTHDGLEREQVIKQLAALVPPSCKVDLDHPDVALSVHCLGRVTSFGVLPQYRALKRYNIRELLSEPKQTTEPAATERKSQSQQKQKQKKQGAKGNKKKGDAADGTMDQKERGQQEQDRGKEKQAEQGQGQDQADETRSSEKQRYPKDQVVCSQDDTIVPDGQAD